MGGGPQQEGAEQQEWRGYPPYVVGCEIPPHFAKIHLRPRFVVVAALPSLSHEGFRLGSAQARFCQSRCWTLHEPKAVQGAQMLLIRMIVPCTQGMQTRIRGASSRFWRSRLLARGHRSGIQGNDVGTAG